MKTSATTAVFLGLSGIALSQFPGLGLPGLIPLPSIPAVSVSIPAGIPASSIPGLDTSASLGIPSLAASVSVPALVPSLSIPGLPIPTSIPALVPPASIPSVSVGIPAVVPSLGVSGLAIPSVPAVVPSISAPALVPTASGLVTSGTCPSYVANFDDLPSSGQIGVYNRASWSEFVILNQTKPYTSATLGPYSNPHFAALMPDIAGTISFLSSNGQQAQPGSLHNFHYACAKPDGLDPPNPIPCEITVTAYCATTSEIDALYTSFTTTLNYDPSAIDRTNPVTANGMAYQSDDFVTALTGSVLSTTGLLSCTNYTFSAVGTSVDPNGNIIIPGLDPGAAPVTLLDDVSYSICGNTPQGACLADPVCAPSGFDVDYYSNSFAGGYSSGQVQSNYYLVDDLQPLQQSTTNITYFPQSFDDTTNTNIVYPNTSLPTRPYFIGDTRLTNGGIVVDANNFTLVYYGFYKAPVTGSYKLCSSADNQNDVYFGDGNAFSCASGLSGLAADPIITSTGSRLNNPVVCASVDMVEGFYYPIRSVTGNKDYGSAFNLTITIPGSNNATDDWTGNAYPQSCGIYAGI